MDYAKGLMTKVLQGGVTSSSALANTLNNSAYKAFATAFDFVGKGSTVTQTASATTAVVSKYVEQSLEDKQGTQNQGVQLALYFTRNASSVTNAYGLLADPSMLKVVETAFGLPASTTADVDSLAKTLGSYVSVADLQNPAKVQKIAERFTAMWDLNGNNTSTDVSSISQIFAASSSVGVLHRPAPQPAGLEARGKLRCAATSTSSSPARSHSRRATRHGRGQPRQRQHRRLSRAGRVVRLGAVQGRRAAGGLRHDGRGLYLGARRARRSRRAAPFDVAIQGDSWFAIKTAGRHGLHARRGASR